MKTRFIDSCSFAVVLALIFFARDLRADLRGLYGLGSRSAALAGSDRAVGTDAFTLSTNPANMAQSEGSQFNLALATTFHQFPKLGGVVVDNPELGSASNLVGDYDPGVASQGYLMVGYIADLARGWDVGVNFLSPIDKFVEAKSVDAYRPNYTLYDGNPQKFSVAFGVSKELLPGFAVGAGGTLYYDVAATIVGRLNQAPQTTTINVGAVPRPGLSPNLGVSAKLREGHVIGASYVGARNYQLDSELKTFIYPVYAGVPIDIAGSASLYYDPATWSLGYGGKWGLLEVFAAVDYEVWHPFSGSAYRGLYRTLAFYQAPVVTEFKDIVVPRFGVALDVGRLFVLRFGYAFRPTPAPDPSVSAANILDADRHVGALGLAYDSGTWAGFWPKPLVFDLSVQCHFLQNRTVTKLDPSGIGAPGYVIGGTAVQAGVQASINF